jgi:hypothetical protein
LLNGAVSGLNSVRVDIGTSFIFIFQDFRIGRTED